MLILYTGLIYTTRWHQGPEQRQTSSFCILLPGLIYNVELLGWMPNLAVMIELIHKETKVWREKNLKI